MNTEKEELLLKKRIPELERLADKRYCDVYSDFLNLNEISLFYGLSGELSGLPYTLYGGYADAERKMLCFHGGGGIKGGQESKPSETFPISCVSVKPGNEKFSDPLTHRDFLGAILNLGIERGKVGDLLVRSNSALIFCQDGIADFLCTELVKVKHTNVAAEKTEFSETAWKPEFKTVTGTLSSIRLDAMISLAFNASRSSLTELVGSGRVFVNGRTELSNSCQPKEGDVISVRGLGKFIFSSVSGQSKKGRIGVILQKYI